MPVIKAIAAAANHAFSNILRNLISLFQIQTMLNQILFS
jgi:hypothetical protein